MRVTLDVIVGLFRISFGCSLHPLEGPQYRALKYRIACSRCYRGIKSNHAGVVHLPAPLALRNFLSQIGQPNIRAVTLNRFLFAIF
jgi:hypothetical protein